ncbi:hypothetical protein PQR53_15265 [Paraburkholderia fungorum]|uniref:hypothetical protein n=1 Tax=Paraburkholderia fungorum TaxID=134537 RepID=UPI0038BD9537
MGEARKRGSLEQRLAALWAEHGVKPWTMERYNAFVAWTRSPIVDLFGEELEFFANRAETLIGVLVLDLTDRDYGFVVLGRDTKGRFRAIDVKVSMNRTDARHALFTSMSDLTASGDTVFAQGDEAEDNASVDLFTPIAQPEELHPSFELLRGHDVWIPARKIMSEMMHHFVDADGNFVQQFQTTAFDARIWELYLYAALLDLGLFVERPDPAPDFMVSRGRQKVYIEAVIAGPSPKDQPVEEDEHGAPKLRSPEEIRELLKTRVPIRFGSALYSKLNRKNPYWELDHVKGNPLVFAVADFHEKRSMTWTSPALLEYLYGVTHDFIFDENGNLVITPIKIETHEHDGKTIPSGYFLQEKAEHVSAVLFSSSGTLSKFNRMGKLAGFGVGNHQMFRVGVRHTHDRNAALPTGFFKEIAPNKTSESWSEGLSMFHNPRALHPIDPGMFPGVAHHFYDEGQITSLLPEFHVYSSYTWNMLITD